MKQILAILFWLFNFPLFIPFIIFNKKCATTLANPLVVFGDDWTCDVSIIMIFAGVVDVWAMSLVIATSIC